MSHEYERSRVILDQYSRARKVDPRTAGAAGLPFVGEGVGPYREWVKGTRGLGLVPNVKGGEGAKAVGVIVVIGFIVAGCIFGGGNDPSPVSNSVRNNFVSAGNVATRYATVNAIRLNLRSSCPEADDAKCPSILEMRQGEKVILGRYKGNEWWEITYTGSDGPVSGFTRAKDNGGRILLNLGVP